MKSNFMYKNIQGDRGIDIYIDLYIYISIDSR